MSDDNILLTPVGRLVQGSLYKAQDKDMQGNPLVFKKGPNTGQPTVKFYFAIAIPKGSEQHWNQTEWGAKIYHIGVTSWPGGQPQRPNFAWKITDGDSAIPNNNDRKPCDTEGFRGNWVIRFSSMFAPTIVNRDGTQQILEKDFINLGDYVQVCGTVTSNKTDANPGLLLNPRFVSFSAYGERIVAGVDPASVGFGKAPLPAGASAVPPAGGFNPTINMPVTAPQQAVVTPTAVYPAYPEILQPPAAPAAPQKIMTPKAGTHTYEQYISNGWTDELLIQHGMMQP